MARKSSSRRWDAATLASEAEMPRPPLSLAKISEILRCSAWMRASQSYSPPALTRGVGISCSPTRNSRMYGSEKACGRQPLRGRTMQRCDTRHGSGQVTGLLAAVVRPVPHVVVDGRQLDLWGGVGWWAGWEIRL